MENPPERTYTLRIAKNDTDTIKTVRALMGQCIDNPYKAMEIYNFLTYCLEHNEGVTLYDIKEINPK